MHTRVLQLLFLRAIWLWDLWSGVGQILLQAQYSRTHNSSTTKLNSLLGVPSTVRSIDSESPYRSHFTTREHPIMSTSHSHFITREHLHLVFVLGVTSLLGNTPTSCFFSESFCSLRTLQLRVAIHIKRKVYSSSLHFSFFF